jgi:hypothetical protein
MDAHISCSIAPDCTPGAWLAATGNRGELMVTNPVAPHLGHLLTIREGTCERRLMVEGDTTYAHQLLAFVGAVRSGQSIATAGDGIVQNMRLIDEVYRVAGLAPRGASSGLQDRGLC